MSSSRHSNAVLNHNKRIPCLDLHGKRRDEAIRAFTCFAEQHSHEWITVVTGTGQHSSHSGGPVLKNAIEKLLKKREMEYQYEKGCFLVNCNSGHELTKSEKVDTKLLFQSKKHASQEVKLVNRPKHAAQSHEHQETTTIFTSSAQHEPLPSQVSQHDDTFLQAKLRSVAEYNLARKHAMKDKRELERAIHESKKPIIDPELERAMSLSQLEFLEKQQEDDELLRRVQSLSELESNETESAFEAQLQEALALSTQQQNESISNDEALLQQAISLSLQERVEESSLS